MFFNDALTALLAGLATEINTSAGTIDLKILKILFGTNGSCEDKYSLPEQIVYVEEPEVYYTEDYVTYVGRYKSNGFVTIDTVALAAEINGSYIPIMKLCIKYAMTPNSTLTVHFSVLKV